MIIKDGLFSTDLPVGFPRLPRLLAADRQARTICFSQTFLVLNSQLRMATLWSLTPSIAVIPAAVPEQHAFGLNIELIESERTK